MNNKEKIFQVSIDLFSKYGYDGVSVRQIASEVGIKESSIYNHYSSKQAILNRILEYYVEEMTSDEIPLTRQALTWTGDLTFLQGRLRGIPLKA